MLPSALGDLTVDDLRQIIADVHGETGSPMLELKEQLAKDAIAKGIAAFANTVGGLMLIGVSDDEQVVGVDSPGEPVVWLKDVLRSRITPLPPLSATAVPLDRGSKAVLAVLVEESTTTPHLLTKSGAIYVRRPGSSEPVPLDDQRTLFDLIQRGRDASDAAMRRADALVVPSGAHRPAYGRQRLAFVPTGINAGYRSRLFSETGLTDVLGAATHAFGTRERYHAPGPSHYVASQWGSAVIRQHHITMEREVETHREARHETVTAFSDGAILLRSRSMKRDGKPLDSLPGISYDALRAELSSLFEYSRELMLDFGAHGDLAIAFAVEHLQERAFTVRVDDEPGRLAHHHVARFDSLSAADDHIVDEILDELTAAAGLLPRAR